jgi:outer membrane protein assembly factor BamB
VNFVSKQNAPRKGPAKIIGLNSLYFFTGLLYLFPEWEARLMKNFSSSCFMFFTIVFFLAGCEEKNVSGPSHVAMCNGSPEQTATGSGVRKLDRIVWNLTGHKRIRSCLLADGDSVYFANRELRDSALYSVDRSTGLVRWVYKDTPVCTSPVIADGMIYFGDEAGVLYAAEVRTGSVSWRFQTGKTITGIHVSPIVSLGVSGDLILAGTADGHVYALSMGSRKEKWKFTTGGAVSSFVASGETVYCASGDGNIYALASRNGTEKWRFAAKGPLSSSLAVSDGKLLFRTGNGNLIALVAESGQMEWIFPATSGSKSSPAVANNTAYFGDDEGNFYAVDVRSGAQKWQFKAGAGISGSPITGKGAVYFGCGDKLLYVLDAETGEMLWMRETEGVVESSPAVADDLVIAGDNEGTISAFGQSGL